MSEWEELSEEEDSQYVANVIRLFGNNYVEDDEEEEPLEEEDEEEEEEEEDKNEEDEITYDTSLPGIHPYLGNIDLLPHTLLHPETDHTLITLPLITLMNVILFPGETLPLRLLEVGQMEVIQQVMESERRLFGVVNMSEKAKMGTVAEIRYVSKGRGGLVGVIAVGRQRFLIKKTFLTTTGTEMVNGLIVEDPAINLPKEAMKGFAYWPSQVWKHYDSHLLMRQAMDLALFGDHASAQTPNQHPTIYSFWLARNLPVPDAERQSLLEAPSTPDRLRMEIEFLKRGQQICCAHCREQLSSSTNIFSMSTNGTCGTYVNPAGVIHETITFRSLNHVWIDPRSRPSTQSSWFPGYAWTIAYCLSCFAHLGWRFDAVKKNTQPQMFWGLRRASLTMKSSEWQ